MTPSGSPKIEELLQRMRNNPAGVRFVDQKHVCGHFFGPPRQRATSHCVYRMPWAGDPRVNIQSAGGKAKAFQVRQVLSAIDKLRAHGFERASE